MKINLKEVVRNPWVVPIAVGVVNFTVGYYFARWKHYRQVSELLSLGVLKIVDEDETEQLTLPFSPISAEQIQEHLEQASQDLVDYRKFFKDHPSNQEEMDPQRKARLLRVVDPSVDIPEVVETSERNIFEENSTFPGWNQELEEKNRSDDAPYILHRDEYFAQENGWNQMTLTYYAGDQILVDERDTPIDNYSRLVGALVFGHGSGDPSVVYIRNCLLKTEFEIMYESGHYTVEVLGHQIETELEHADELKHARRTPRFPTVD